MDIFLVEHVMRTKTEALPDPTHVVSRVGVFFLLLGWATWRVHRKHGWMGLLYKASLFLDGSYLYICMSYETINPWALHNLVPSNHSPYLAVFLILFSLSMCADWIIRWLDSNEEAAKCVVFPALGLVMITLFVIVDKATDPPFRAPVHPLPRVSAILEKQEVRSLAVPTNIPS